MLYLLITFLWCMGLSAQENISSIASHEALQAQQSLLHKNSFDKTFGNITSSLPFYALEALNPLGLIVYLSSNMGARPASKFFQQLGTEAQTTVGIPHFFHVPIRKFKNDVDFGACTTPHAIYVNEEIKAPYGRNRVMMFHEAIHKKYNDFTRSIYAPAVIAIISYIAFNIILKSIFKLENQDLREFTAATEALICSYVNFQKILSSGERRADTEALYAAACHNCAQDVSDERKKSEVKKNLAARGYLLSHEITKIAHELKEQNKICKFHESQAILDQTLSSSK